MGTNICPCVSNVKVWADANFSCNWFPKEAKHDSDTARSFSGFFVSYLGCPVIGKLQLKTDISLSSTDSE